METPKKTSSSTQRSHMRNLGILAAALVVCAVAYFAVQNLSASEDTTEETETLFLNIAEDDIVAISWTYDGEEGAITLEDDTWESVELPDVSLDQSSALQLAESLASAELQRSIDASDISEEMGLDDASISVTVSLSDGETISFSLGSATSDGNGYYANLEGQDGASVIDTSLGSAFAISMLDLYAKDGSPSAASVDSLSLSQDSGTLTLSQDSDGVAQSYTTSYTWYAEDEDGGVATTSTLANSVVSLVNYVSWSSLVDPAYDGQTDYGFDNPTLTATLSYTETTQEDSGEVDEDGDTIYNEVETSYTYVLLIGSTTSSGDYYAKPQDSDKVYTLSSSTVETLLEASTASLRPDDVCLMDWDTVDSIEITADGETYTLAIVRSEADDEDDSDEDETETSYTLDGSEIDSEAAEALLDAIDALESEGEGEASLAQEDEATLSFVFNRNTDTYSQLTLSFTRYDNSFYLVSFFGGEYLLVNRNDVSELLDLVAALQ